MKSTIKSLITGITLFASASAFGSYVASQDGDKDGCINDNNWNGKVEICDGDESDTYKALGLLVIGGVILYIIQDKDEYANFVESTPRRIQFNTEAKPGYTGISISIPFDLK